MTCGICLKQVKPGYHLNGLMTANAARARNASGPLLAALTQRSRTNWMQRFALLHALTLPKEHK